MSCCGKSHDSPPRPLYPPKSIEEASQFFERIGEESLLLINKNRNEKNETWEKAIEINMIARKGFDALKNFK